MPRWSDGQVERFLAGLLRAGVYLSAALVLAGAAVHLAGHAGSHPELGVFRGEPSALRGVAGIVGAAATLDGRGIIQLGLLLLVATPVARVAFSALAFAAMRDWRYVAVTLVVLGVLGFSLFAAHT